MGNAPFHKSREIQQAFEDFGHFYFHLPSLAPFFNHVAQWIFGHIKKHVQWVDFQNPPTLTCHIHDDVQGWIREANQKFGRASHGECLGESYTQCTILCERKVYNS
jgi:hypothetical protein